jgi:hypothetical protein
LIPSLKKRGELYSPSLSKRRGWGMSWRGEKPGQFVNHKWTQERSIQGVMRNILSPIMTGGELWDKIKAITLFFMFLKKGCSSKMTNVSWSIFIYRATVFRFNFKPTARLLYSSKLPVLWNFFHSDANV